MVVYFYQIGVIFSKILAILSQICALLGVLSQAIIMRWMRIYQLDVQMSFFRLDWHALKMDSALERLLSTIFVCYGGSIKVELQDINGVGVT